MNRPFEFDLNAALDRIAARRQEGGARASTAASATAGASQLSREPAPPGGQADGSTFRRERSAELSGSQMSQMSQVAASCRAMSLELTDDEREEFEERAAIVEFDGGLTRIEAERLAFAWIVARR